ncbi:hypothetical protein HH212_20055 [Massilia forsythiae]|uniref:Immunity protein 52 domain-containing protein n=1 Tax=Massilia forsythiae TaxID=2728020 RepID=A0A7Z2VZI3_9BURK|nr:Imm52 family immunity protein [Massilia forsythiae]QJE02028.1 hypothetical protein HH212_20055 [Massilia forsythiae]
MNPNLNHQLEVRFDSTGQHATSFDFHLRLISRFLRSVARFDPLLEERQWLIATGDRETSHLYPVFDADGPTTAALAVLHQYAKASEVVRNLTLWNGQEDRAKGASISCQFGRQDGVASSFRLSIRSPRGRMRLGEWRQVAEAIAFAATIFEPLYASVATMYYDAVFKDRAGVGWMLYLPRMLSVQQVPEAHALVPVMIKDEQEKDKQIGTIVVSVTDAPFSDDDPGHVEKAHAIEVRLVDQDLLPRFVDL